MVGDNDAVAQPPRHLISVRVVGVSFVHENYDPVVLHVPNHTADRLINGTGGLLVVPVFAVHRRGFFNMLYQLVICAFFAHV